MAENDQDKRDENLDGIDAYSDVVGTDLDDETPDKPTGMPLHTKVLIGLLVGVGLGLLANYALGGDSRQVTWIVENITRPIGQLFLNLLLMIVIPLVFSSLIVGVAGIGDIRKLGRIGLKSFAYTMVISAISVLIGLTLANVIRPGDRINPETKAKLEQKYHSDAEKKVADQEKAKPADSPMMQVVTTIVPKNIFYSISAESPNMLHVMFFALFIGIAITLIPTTVTAPFVSVMEGLFEITSKIIDIVMKIAPYAVACLLFTNVSVFGIDLLKSLGWFVFTVLLGLSLHFFGTYSIALRFFTHMRPTEFFRRVWTIIVTAFSTSSSNATLPTALRVSEENLGVPKDINNFVLTVGATANQNGTALYEGITILFIAQLAGMQLSIGQQAMIVVMAVLGGIGTAGVPSGSIPFIIGILAMIGIDPALVGIILGVDRLLDMCRTTLNVVGDVTAAVYVAESEGYQLKGDRRVPKTG